MVHLNGKMIHSNAPNQYLNNKLSNFIESSKNNIDNLNGKLNSLEGNLAAFREE